MHLNDIHALPHLAKVIERFERFTIPEPNTGCLLWLGGVDKDGYGKFRIDGFDFRAHRVGRALSGMRIEDLPLLHKCDTPSCVNGNHTFHGTQAENIADKVEKCRQARGEMQGTAVLTAEQVIEIYLSREPQIPTAAKYGIGQEHVSSIRRGKAWVHVTGPLMAKHEVVDCRRTRVRNSG